MTDRELLELAVKVKKNAYVPYSNFRVGAALVTENGSAYTGVNIENASYGATNCAERTAVFKAVSEGEKKIKAIAISSDSDEFIYPCGICRQVLSEFGDADMKVVCSKKNGEYVVHTLKELLPSSIIPLGK
jgi:cytidine deaminase